MCVCVCTCVCVCIDVVCLSLIFSLLSLSLSLSLSPACSKFIGLKHYYFRSPFNLFDLVLLLISWLDVLLEILSLSEVGFPIRVIGFLRITRLARVLKLFKVCAC